MKKTCDTTIQKIPKHKHTKINTHSKLDKLANEYFPYEKELKATKPKRAHIKTKTVPETDWVSILNQAYSPTKPGKTHSV